MEPETFTPQFLRSSFCGGGECIEVAHLKNGDVVIRDSKDPQRSVLSFTKSEWSDFIKGVKAGEFDTRLTPGM